LIVHSRRKKALSMRAGFPKEPFLVIQGAVFFARFFSKRV
jgi:hypothetical protein